MWRRGQAYAPSTRMNIIEKVFMSEQLIADGGEGFDWEEIGWMCGTSGAYAKQLMARFDAGLAVDQPLPRGGANNVVVRTPECLAYLGLLWQRAPRSQLLDYVRALREDLNIHTSESTLCALFQDLHLNLRLAPKVNPNKYRQENVDYYFEYLSHIIDVPGERVRCVDETGYCRNNIGCAPVRAFPGDNSFQNYIQYQPAHARDRYTIFGMTCIRDDVPPLVVSEPILSTCGSLEYLEFMTGPVIETVGEDLIVHDNWPGHFGEFGGWVRDALEARGATLIELPVYSPELNPIELAWGKMKALMRYMDPNTNIHAALQSALDRTTRANMKSWYAKCGLIV